MRSTSPVAPRAPRRRLPSSPVVRPAAPPRRAPRLVAFGLVIAGIAATLGVVWSHTNSRRSEEPNAASRRAVRLVADGALVRRLPAALAAAPIQRLRRELELPTQMVEDRGRARITFGIDAAATAGRIADAAATGAATVEVARRPVASKIATPRIVRGRTTAERALCMLVGTERCQALQDAGPPLADQASRAEVLRAVASAGVGLRDLTGVEPADIYRRLLRGRLVMVWVRAPASPEAGSSGGSTVTGARPIVLRGVRTGGAVRMVDPGSGVRETWSRQYFETRWRRARSWALGT